MSVRGIPAQDLLENQDPSVLYVVDEVTKQVTSIAPSVAQRAPQLDGPKPKRRGRKPASEEVATDEPTAPEGEGE